MSSITVVGRNAKKRNRLGFNKANDQYCEKRKARIEEEARLIEEYLKGQTK